jgi:hypothetical protein
MLGLEIVAFTVVFIFSAIGLIRGLSKELGVTMAVVVLLAALLQLQNVIPLGSMAQMLNTALSAIGLGSDDVLQQKTMVWFLNSAVVVVTAFLAYHGQDTLAFNLKGPRGIIGVILGGLAGAVNGYFIGGTVWYYLYALDYPIVRYEWFTLPLTATAQSLVSFLPQNLFGGLALSAMALALLWWRILK